MKYASSFFSQRFTFTDLGDVTDFRCPEDPVLDLVKGCMRNDVALGSKCQTPTTETLLQAPITNGQVGSLQVESKGLGLFRDAL